MLYIWLLKKFFFNIYDFLADECGSTNATCMHGVHFLNCSTESFSNDLTTKSDAKYFNVLVILVDILNKAAEQRDPGQVTVD